MKINNTFFPSNHTLIQPEIVSYYSPKPSIIECRFCHDENSFEIHDGATFCMNCGNESEEHGQELVYEIQDLIEDTDTESEEDDENLDYPDHDTDEEENNEFSEDSDEFSEADTNISLKL